MTQQKLNDYWQAFLDDETHRHSLYLACISYAKYVLRGHPEQDALAHQAAWQAWADYPRKPETKTFAHWYFLLVRDAERKHRRREGTIHRAEENSVFARSEPAFSPGDRQNMLAAAGKERNLVTRLLHGDTLEELAESLNVTVVTLRRRLRALRAVQID